MAERDFLTIVSGLPRSGTSMMMKMAEAGGIPVIVDNIRQADEDNPKGYYEFEPVKKTKEDASWVAGSEGKCVKMVYRLLYDMPAGHEYRVLFMRRNLDEVLKSQEVMLERSGKKGGGLSDEQFKALFQKEIDQCLEWIDAQPNMKCLQVDYNRMLVDPQPLVEQINEFLGGGLDIEAMVGVVDPSLYRQRA
ncbi:MAG: sulfotransferase family protein [Planctomycetota bacterium]|nr:MAG: sulfotransferase family protein [Planctomycetota bacterium]